MYPAVFLTYFIPAAVILASLADYSLPLYATWGCDGNPLHTGPYFSTCGHFAFNVSFQFSVREKS